MSLFAKKGLEPLAEQLRPQQLEDVLGQDHLLGKDASLRRMLDSGKMSSLILWGPPGCGKTTLARLLSGKVNLRFESISAIFSGVGDLRKTFQEAEKHFELGQGTLLFVDEIHRFNKSQQDSFLPYVEKGIITLVGATTENPSFELNAALLSRTQVFVLKKLDEDALAALLKRAEQKTHTLPLEEEARKTLLQMADGDGRYLLNMVEMLLAQPKSTLISSKDLPKILQKRALLYDKDGEEHYNLISALHKSLRGSDADAALYWFYRMLSGGEDPLYIGRRLVRFATEDVGLSDPGALTHALNAVEAYKMLGSPEGELALASSVVYLATSPKSNAIYKAEKITREAAKKTGALKPPLHILNAPTKLMKELGYGKEYAYDHETEHGFSGQNYFPEGMARTNFYTPSERGFEREIKKRLEYWQRLREELNKPSKAS